MGNTNINIRIDSKLKKQFENFCDDMGMSMTTAFNIFAKKVVREYRIPFEIGSEIPNEETVNALKEVEMMKKSNKKVKAYADVDEMLRDILV